MESESVESLNAASAAAIMLYEAVCQRGESKLKGTDASEIGPRSSAEFE
jgi:hypothetical protein